MQWPFNYAKEKTPIAGGLEFGALGEIRTPYPLVRRRGNERGFSQFNQLVMSLRAHNSKYTYASLSH